MPDPLLFQLQQVVKAYEGRTILTVDGLELRRGEIFGLVGPSGVGKSTLLRLLTFLELPDRGAIVFDGQRYGPGCEPSLAQRRRITTVFQRPMLLQRSVADNVAYGLKLRGAPDDRGAVHAALAEVGLAAQARQRAHTLSGGEMQRVALARAILIRPDALLLDEPTANLDPYNVGLFEETVVRLNREQGTTIVLVTHNTFQAQRLAHRVGLMLEGRMVETAPAASFFTTPTDPRTRAFVRGEMVY
jgi:tungstate transport system ATP-binding protein